MASLWVFFGAAALLLRVGYALYLAGISRSKNTASTLFQSVIEIAVGILAFWLVGAAIRDGFFAEIAAPRGFNSLFVAATFLIGPAVVAGAGLERAKSIVPLAAAALMPGIITPLASRLLHWDWLVQRGFVDESGAVFIHFSAGLAALAVAIAIGPRLGKYNRDGSTNAIPGHSLPLASAGILLILVTWICYVAGNAVGGPLAAFNSVLAAAAGVVASAVYSRFRFGRQDVFLAYAGLLGGLVSVTSAPDRLTPACAVAAGVVAGLIVPYAIVRLDLTAKIDDPASGIAIHGLAGLWSALAIAILAPGSWSQRASRLSAQAVALGIVAALTLAAFAVLLLALRFTTGIRCSETDEFDGLDLTQYDLNAYPDFQQTTIKSYHLREM